MEETQSAVEWEPKSRIPQIHHVRASPHEPHKTIGKQKRWLFGTLELWEWQDAQLPNTYLGAPLGAKFKCKQVWEDLLKGT